MDPSLRQHLCTRLPSLPPTWQLTQGTPKRKSSCGYPPIGALIGGRVHGFVSPRPKRRISAPHQAAGALCPHRGQGHGKPWDMCAGVEKGCEASGCPVFAGDPFLGKTLEGSHPRIEWGPLVQHTRNVYQLQVAPKKHHG